MLSSLKSSGSSLDTSETSCHAVLSAREETPRCPGASISKGRAACQGFTRPSLTWAQYEIRPVVLRPRTASLAPPQSHGVRPCSFHGTAPQLIASSGSEAQATGISQKSKPSMKAGSEGSTWTTRCGFFRLCRPLLCSGRCCIMLRLMLQEMR